MALTKMAMRIALFAVAFVAVFQSQITVDAQPLTALTIPEILSDQRNANQFTILADMFQKWFPPGTGDSLFACDSGNEFTFFAPSDLAWDNSWLTANTQTLDRTKLIDYYSIPETLTYHLFFGITDRNNLIPPTNTPVKQFMVSGSPIYLFRETDAAGTTFPSIGGGFAGNNITIGTDVQIINGCNSIIYVLNEQTLLPPQPQPNAADIQTPRWLVATNGTSLLYQIGSQQTDLYSDDENGNTRGLPECILLGQRAPFSACTPKPITEVLGYCDNLAYSNPGRDAIAQEMNEVFQERVADDQEGTTTVPPPTCPGSTPYNYYNNGVSFSLTLLDYCGLIGAIDDPSAELTLFLPTNAAWIKATTTAVPQIDVNSLTSAPYSAWICDLIAYHAVPQKLEFFGELAENELVLPTLAGEGFDLLVRRRGLETKINQSNIVALPSVGQGVVAYRIDFPLNPSVGPSSFGLST
jgi:uncharacterized surface protein with fasciclin (FAS1) repeats